MTIPIKLAHLCGALGQALAIVGEETWLYEKDQRRRPTANEIHFFFEHGLEVRPVHSTPAKVLTEDDLRTLIDLEDRRFKTLQGVLVGMDSDLDAELRQRRLRWANRSLPDTKIAEFVERRFLRPLPQQSWDLAGALRLARNGELAAVERLYTIVNGPLLQHLEDEIASWASEQDHSSVERRVSLDRAYDTGLVAAMATALHDGNASQVRTKIFLAPDAGWDRQLAARLVSRFAAIQTSMNFKSVAHEDDEETLEPPTADIVAQVHSRIMGLLDDYRSRLRPHGNRRPSGRNAAEALQAALKEIEWIVRRFEAGQFHAAWADVADLAKQQLAEGDPEKLAMSLTNLATRLSSEDGVALALYDIAAVCSPNDPAISSARAETLRSLGRFEEALAAYDRAIEAFPQDSFARSGRAETLRSLGRFEDALTAYDRTIEAFPLDAVARNGRAETLRSLGRFEDALTAYDRTIEAFPQDAVARNGRAEALRSLGRFEEALAAYDRTIEAFPQNAVARNGRAETLRSLGRFEGALAAYDRAIEAFPHDAFARNGRAETLRSLGRFEEALAAYDRAIEAFPHGAVARSGRAETLRSLGRFEEALAAYDRAIEAFPHDAFARNGRAVILSDLGRYDEARAALADFGAAPSTRDEWFAAYMLCVIDAREDATAALAARLERFEKLCPFDQRRYFQTLLVVVRLALKQSAKARDELKELARRPELGVDERTAVQLMEAHAEAADGDMETARRSLATASNVVSNEQFQLRRIQREVERRFGLGSMPQPTRSEDIANSDKRLVRVELDFWIDRVRQLDADRRAA